MKPDEGFGRPGSLQWHTLHIKQCESVAEVFRYVRSVTCKPIPIPRKLVEELALEAIKEHLANG